MVREILTWVMSLPLALKVPLGKPLSLLVKTSNDALLSKTLFQLLMFWHQTRTPNQFLFYSDNYFACLWKGSRMRMRKKAKQVDLSIPKQLCRDIAVMQQCQKKSLCKVLGFPN